MQKVKLKDVEAQIDGLSKTQFRSLGRSLVKKIAVRKNKRIVLKNKKTTNQKTLKDLYKLQTKTGNKNLSEKIDGIVYN